MQSRKTKKRTGWVVATTIAWLRAIVEQLFGLIKRQCG